MDMRPIRINLDPPFYISLEGKEDYDLSELRICPDDKSLAILILQTSYKNREHMAVIARALFQMGASTNGI